MDGYGRIMINRICYKAHRLSWEIFNNKGIPSGMCILHNCPKEDNRKCVNPEHLRIGTPFENMQDRKKKGMYKCGKDHPLAKNPSFAARGSKCGNSKFSEKEVIEMRKIYSLGKHSLSQLGRMFKCKHSTIRRIVKREGWTHI
jgi:hypothetical protein